VTTRPWNEAEAERLRRYHTPQESRPMNATADPAVIAREARNRRILELHRDGLSERQIAAELGVSRTTVWTVIQAAKGS
jgi:DNA-binding NarL/FixJ family response regulator